MALSTEYIKLLHLIAKTVRSFWAVYVHVVLSTKGLTVNVVKPTSATPTSKLPVVAVSTVIFYGVCWRVIMKIVDFWWSVTGLYLHIDFSVYFYKGVFKLVEHLR